VLAASLGRLQVGRHQKGPNARYAFQSPRLAGRSPNQSNVALTGGGVEVTRSLLFTPIIHSFILFSLPHHESDVRATVLRAARLTQHSHSAAIAHSPTGLRDSAVRNLEVGATARADTR